MSQSLSKHWQLFLRSSPGRRFQDVHERRRSHRGARSATKRHALLASGAILAFAGVALLPLPGPGTLVLAAGLILLARESMGIARLLDAADKKRHEGMECLRITWLRCGTMTRVLLVVLSAGLVIAAAVGMWLLLIR